MKNAIRNTTTADRILFILLLAISFSGIFISRNALSLGTGVTIEVDGRAVYSLPLDINREVTVDGPYGPSVVEIRTGKVRIKESHCRNQICVKEGWVSQGLIICLPNRLVVFVGRKPDTRKKDLDAITG